VALTGHHNVAYIWHVRMTGHRFATFVVNKSYRRYTVCHTTSVEAYIRQTLVNSHPGNLSELKASWYQVHGVMQFCVNIRYVTWSGPNQAATFCDWTQQGHCWRTQGVCIGTPFVPASLRLINGLMARWQHVGTLAIL